MSTSYSYLPDTGIFYGDQDGRGPCLHIIGTLAMKRWVGKQTAKP